MIVQMSDAKIAQVYIGKNGTAVANHQAASLQSWGSLDYAGQSVCGPVVMNGSSDWCVAIVYHNQGSDRTYIASTLEAYQFFWGFRLSV